MELGISGRMAVVAGGSAGMGKAAATALAREGVQLVISARGEKRLDAAVREIREETGAKVTAVVADHSTSEGRNALLQACPAPDILVMTSSPPPILSGFDDASESDWLSALQSTFIGPVELLKATVGGMAERGFGRVVVIGTIAAKNPVEPRLLSGTGRAALSNYTGAVARKLAASNVAINTILPGLFHTEGIRPLVTMRSAAAGTSYDAETQSMARELGVPAARFGSPQDVGAFCALLCSQYASYVIGQNIVIDGGLVRSIF